MSKEPDDPPTRKTVTLPASMWREITEHRFANRIGTEAEAVRQLLHAALRSPIAVRKPPRKGVKP
jgi:hypothetical protein